MALDGASGLGWDVEEVRSAGSLPRMTARHPGLGPEPTADADPWLRHIRWIFGGCYRNPEQQGVGIHRAGRLRCSSMGADHVISHPPSVGAPSSAGRAISPATELFALPHRADAGDLQRRLRGRLGGEPPALRRRFPAEMEVTQSCAGAAAGSRRNRCRGRGWSGSVGASSCPGCRQPAQRSL